MAHRIALAKYWNCDLECECSTWVAEGGEPHLPGQGVRRARMATDLWIDVNENQRRFRELGLKDLVFPVPAEAHALPYGEGFFDALVSLDAYHYFGTDDLYLGRYFAPLVKPTGHIGIVVPGLVKQFNDDPPAHLAPIWAQDWEVLELS